MPMIGFADFVCNDGGGEMRGGNASHLIWRTREININGNTFYLVY
jgi:hypothetical protein